MAPTEQAAGLLSPQMWPSVTAPSRACCGPQALRLSYTRSDRCCLTVHSASDSSPSLEGLRSSGVTPHPSPFLNWNFPVVCSVASLLVCPRMAAMALDLKPAVSQVACCPFPRPWIGVQKQRLKTDLEAIFRVSFSELLLGNVIKVQGETVVPLRLSIRSGSDIPG